jgi:hypothetical protein
MHKKKLFSVALAATLPFPTHLLAESQVDDRLESAEKRLEYLESRVQDQDRTMNEKAAGESWFNNVEINGVIEVEAGFEDPEDGDSESSLTLATAELGITAQITEMLSGEIVLLYEDDGEEELDVDVAAITIAPNGNLDITAGQFYVPFGVYETHMVSDPLTLKLGETRETAVQAAFDLGPVGVAAYIFDGDATEDGDSKIDNFGLDLALAQEADNFSYSANLGYINDIGDTNGLIDYATDVHDNVAGMSFSLVVTTGPFTVIGEYVGAMDEFDATGEEPSAHNLELGYGFELAGREAGVAIGVQGTDDAEGVDLPEDAVVAAFGIEIIDSASLALEYANAEAYDGTEVDVITLQLAAEF